jgi:4-carboxymuconolactone decarboxylase
MPIYLHHPKPGRLFVDLIDSLTALQGLPQSARETAILALGSLYDAKYMVYAHERIAANHTSLTAEQIREIKAGEKPLDLGEPESVAYEVAVELVSRMGPLSEGAWERAVKILGREGAVALVHFVGFYAYTAVLLNGFDVPLPEGEVNKI